MPLRTHIEVSSDVSIQDICVVSGPESGVSFDGNSVRISEALCANLAKGERKSVLVTYSVVGHYGGEIPKTAVFTLSSKNGSPVISSNSLGEPLLRHGKACFDLLAGQAA